MKMNKKQKIIIAAVAGCLVLGALLLYAIGSGRYPIALVGWQPVTTRDLEIGLRMASAYSRKIVSVTQATTTAILDPSSREAQAIVLDQLIENRIVAEELRKEIGSDAATLVGAKLARYRDDPQLVRAASDMFAATRAELEKYSLRPQAERDVLKGHYFLKGKDFSVWLATARHEAKVTILSSSFEWQDGKVLVSEER
ncbi:MAG: hypothetical protein HY978_01065 [Candidatus Liptonbacteria bacterium]|nr:hypothetical protein [Candidatus Liptonbacteria bacterium]